MVKVWAMDLGMTHGELGLVVFLLALVWGAQGLSKVGGWVGGLFARKR